MKTIALLMEIEDDVGPVRDEESARQVEATRVQMVDFLNDLTRMNNASVANDADTRLMDHSTWNITVV